MPIRITSEPTPWPSRSDGRQVAAVNSFGLSGTNAHVVLEGYGSPANGADIQADGSWPTGHEQTVAVELPDVDEAAVTERERTERSVRVLPLSARSSVTLPEMARRYLAWLDSLEVPATSSVDVDQMLADAAWTAGTGRRHFEYRVGLTFSDAAELRAALNRLANSEASPGHEEPRSPARTAFVYTGADRQRGSATKDLYTTEPAVRAVLDACDRVVRDECGASLLDAIFGEGGAGQDVDGPALERAARFAVQAALTALWRSIGVRPNAVLGEGIGELAAAYAAGVLDPGGWFKDGNGAERPRCGATPYYGRPCIGDHDQQRPGTGCAAFRRFGRRSLAEARRWNCDTSELRRSAGRNGVDLVVAIDGVVDSVQGNGRERRRRHAP